MRLIMLKVSKLNSDLQNGCIFPQFLKNEYFMMSGSVLRFPTDASLQFPQALLQFATVLSKAFNLYVTHNHYKPFTNICQAFIN